ncbi:MAG TPA: hypothetical protein VHU24_03190 [Solirubrobacterales bacterium]|jgi:hypothetical protein|nr:hypothetical protein [Solirubrobacterales bacterium]
MPAALPLVEDRPGETPSLWSFGGGAEASAAGVPASASGSLSVGSGAAGSESTHLWVAGVMLVALLLVIGFHASGFRFATDIGVTGG